MKIAILTLVLILSIGLTVINAQDRYLSAAEYPSQIKEYVSTYFSKSNIISVKKEKVIFKTEYEVKLNTGEELEFDKSFSIVKLESKMGLPDSVIPAKIRDYVSKNYPHQKIEEWKMKRRTQEIELDNSLELIFTSDGDFVRIDD